MFDNRVISRGKISRSTRSVPALRLPPSPAPVRRNKLYASYNIIICLTRTTRRIALDKRVYAPLCNYEALSPSGYGGSSVRACAGDSSRQCLSLTATSLAFSDDITRVTPLRKSTVDRRWRGFSLVFFFLFFYPRFRNCMRFCRRLSSGWQRGVYGRYW